MARQVPGQVPCPSGARFHGPAQRIGDPLQMRSQSIGNYRDMLPKEQHKKIFRRKIYEHLKPYIRGDISQDFIFQLVRCVEEYHGKASTSVEEYWNMDILASHVCSVIANLRKKSEASLKSKLVKSSSSVGAMIPTSGMMYNSHSNVIIPDSANSFDDPEDSSSMLLSSSSSTGMLERSASQSSVIVLRGTVDTPNGSDARWAGVSAADSSASQKIMPFRQYAGEQVTCLLQGVESQTRAGVRPNIQQNYSRYDDGSGIHAFVNGSQMETDSISHVSYLSDIEYGVPPRPPQQQFDYHQQGFLVHAGGQSGLTTFNPTVSRSFHGHEPADGSWNIPPNINKVRLQSSNMVIGNQLQVQPNQYEACTMGAQSPLVEQGTRSTASSDHVIPLQQNHHVVNVQKRVNGLLMGVGQEMIMQGRHCAESEEKASFPGGSPQFHRMQELLSPRNSGRVEPACHNISSEGLISGRAISLRTTEAKQIFVDAFGGPRSAICESTRLVNLDNALKHGHSCRDAVKCSHSRCEHARMLWLHVEGCAISDCSTPFCHQSKLVLAHRQQCRNPTCLVSSPARNWTPHNKSGASVSIPMVGNSKTSIIGDANATLLEFSQMVENKEDLHSSPKRLKLESASDPIIPSGDKPSKSFIANNDSHVPMDPQPQGLPTTGMAFKSKLPEVKVETSASSVSSHTQLQMETDIADADGNQKPDVRPFMSCDSAFIAKKEISKHDLNTQANQDYRAQCSESAAEVKSVKPKMKADVRPLISCDSAVIAKQEIIKPDQDMQHNQENGAGPLESAAEVKSKKPKLKANVRPLISCVSAVIVRQEIVKKDQDMQRKQESRAGPSESSTEVKSEKPKIKTEVCPLISCDSAVIAKQEAVKHDQDMPANQEMEAQPSESAAEVKSGKPKIKGVSLIELFSPEQVREHLIGLRQWIGQSKAKAVKNQAMQFTMSENSCHLCAVESLTFEPPPIYCYPCGARIKRYNIYYTVGVGYTRHYFCLPCYNGSRGGEVMVGTDTIPKSKMEKKKNDEVITEAWAQCDKCQSWQHQICALFNGKWNDSGQAEYTCPTCYIQEVESGEREPLPHSAVLGAKDLPRTLLSDHIEQRLFRNLERERLDRARQQGKSYDEVPGVEGIVVRVVSSVDKRLEVKPRLREILTVENYPVEIPYKSKVILLFQKIEGVDVCLFGIYVQEFGSECPLPNQRRVYISYLDSVKYFRPDVRAVTGEALRTFVYHEILIGYLEYCKKRGFSSCNIWACAPLNGEDYIMYCHPEIQKTPKSDKLRAWYLSVLKKAIRENIVVELTNLYDHFFLSTDECKAKVTAARLPNFDGDYWPGAAEEIINLLNLEKEGGKEGEKEINKGTTKKTITKRALKAAGQSDLSSKECKDLVLMQRLGETIGKIREDFIVVHLTHSCTHCRGLLVSGNRWVCRQCKNFQLCDKCYEAEQELEDRDKHPIKLKQAHTLTPVPITDVPEDTKDKDEIIECEFFDTRQAFLSLCQGNHYQYDTLRRAKHSSMMILYHLHNPTAPAFVTTCNVCQLDVESGQGWRCETCPDFDVCDACYKKDSGNNHPHKLTMHKGAKEIRAKQLKKILQVLVHASQCRAPACNSSCQKMKQIFGHGSACKVRAVGGCALCKKMWHILHLHSRVCKDPDCKVPRCRDIKEHLGRLQQQSDSRRRAAVMEMMRQQASDVA